MVSSIAESLEDITGVLCLRSLVLVLLLGPASSAQVSLQHQRASTPVSRALLVGIEAYRPHPKVSWTPLSGPKEDVHLLRRALVEVGGFDPKHIRVLFDEQATHLGILGAFSQMIEESAPGDLLLFYFSGHGSSLQDDLDLDEPDGLDETLVPYDAVRNDRRNDIRDDTLRRFIERANRKTDHVVVILDCCNSGTATRNAAAFDGTVVRSVPGDVEDNDLRDRGIGGKRLSANSDESESGYLAGPLSYVALTACRAGENARELWINAPDGERRRHGLFTYHLIEQLHRLAPGMSYAEWLDLVKTRIAARKWPQTPVVEGVLRHKPIFALTSTSTPFFYVIDDGSGPFIQGGRVHGLVPGTLVSICPPGTQLVGAESILGQAILIDVGLNRSKIRWIPSALPPSPLPDHCRAFEASPSSLEKHLVDVAIEGEGLDLSEAASILESSGWVRCVTPDRAECLLRRTGEDEPTWILCSRSGKPLGIQERSALPGPVIVDALSALTRAKRTRSLGVHSDSLDVAFEISRMDPESARPIPDSMLSPSPSGLFELNEGERIHCRVENRSSIPLYASVFIVSSDAEIDVLWSTENEDDVLRPGTTRWLGPMILTCPMNAEAFLEIGGDTLKCLVSTEPHDLMSLEQASVLRGTRGLGKRLSPHPLVHATKWTAKDIELRIAPRPR